MMKTQSQLCLAYHHDFCSQCDCQCHYDWNSFSVYSEFLKECIDAQVATKTTHKMGEYFTGWWDVATMWISNKYPEMTAKDMLKLVDEGWLIINGGGK